MRSDLVSGTVGGALLGPVLVHPQLTVSIAIYIAI